MSVCEQEKPVRFKAPFPWFGGKSRIAPEVWARFGDVPNYCEPFFGTGAVMFARPTLPRTETINDKDGFLANFWRAIKANPAAVAEHADWPVNEIDLAARRDYLFSGADEWHKAMWADPHLYCAKRAGWWVWGVCSTIGNAWKPRSTHLGAGMGIHRPSTHLGAGRGIHRPGTHIGEAGRGDVLREYFALISRRMERVRVMCGDWQRILGPTPTAHNGVTGVFLDPPYFDGCQDDCYSHNGTVALHVQQWCAENGENPKLRIALCGYDGEHNALEDIGWSVLAWKASGGYAKAGNDNARRERIWFSPHCLKPEQLEIEP